MHKLLKGTCLFAIASAAALAQHAHDMSPYAHTQSAEIPSLTAEEVRTLRSGDGMGLARAAELNHFPGPRHLLELASQLGLSTAQIRRVEEIHKTMKARAVVKGEQILRAELHLSNLFSAGKPSMEETRRITGHLGTMRGQLQAIHLLAHIEAARELKADQIRTYDRLRGYAH